MSRRITRRMAAEMAASNPAPSPSSSSASSSSSADAAARAEARAEARALAVATTARKKEAAAAKRQAEEDAKAAKAAEFAALIASPTVTGPQLDAHMMGKPNDMWNYKKHWRAAMHKWIERAQWGPIFWYLNIWLKADGFGGMPFLEDILDKMRDAQPEGLFRSSEMWTQLRTFVQDVGVPWWENHVKSSILDVAYTTQLFKHNWPGVTLVLLQSLRGRGRDTAPSAAEVTLYTEAAKYVYRKNIRILQFNLTSTANTISQVAVFDTTVSPNAHARSLLVALIMERPDSPPLVVTPDHYTTLTQLLTKYISMGEQGRPVIDAFLFKFDMGRTENKLFLQHMFLVVISSNRAIFHNSSAASQKLYLQMIELFVREYRININNLYVDMDATEQGTLTALINQTALGNDPLANPSRWMSKNLPLVALAIMYGNKKALLFLVSLGATVKRCAFTLADLTTDPAIHKVLLADANATKIQRAYQRHMYAPEHATQSTRQAVWDRKIRLDTTS